MALLVYTFSIDRESLDKSGNHLRWKLQNPTNHKRITNKCFVVTVRNSSNIIGIFRYEMVYLL